MGLVGLWDMHELKRTRFLGCSATARVLRGIYDVRRRLDHPELTPLPEPGHVLRGLTCTELAVAARDPGLLRCMLERIIDEHAGSGVHLVHVGFAKNDPLRRAVASLARQRFRSLVVAGGQTGWAERAGKHALADPYVDMAML